MDETSGVKLLARRRIYSKPAKGQSKLDPTLMRFDSDQKECRSWVIAFLEHIEGFTRNIAKSIEDTGNAARTVKAPLGYTGSWLMDVYSPIHTITYGIVVGSDSTGETNTDPALNTQIADGTGAGEIEYDGHAYETTAVVGANVDFELRRTFTNNSGGNVDVKELGLYCRSEDTGNNMRYFCLAREVISTDTIADGETYEVVLTFRTTV